MALNFSAKLLVDMPKTFGGHLKVWRERAGLNHTQLADQVGISANHIINLEKDVSPSSTKRAAPLVKRDLCNRIARALKVPRVTVYMAAYIPELLDRDFGPANTRRLVACFEELPAERQEDVIDLTETFWRKYAAKPPSEPKEAA